MLATMCGFVQSTDCAVQTIDPYFARAIHGLRSHSVGLRVYTSQLCTLAVKPSSHALRCDAFARVSYSEQTTRVTQ